MAGISELNLIVIWEPEIRMVAHTLAHALEVLTSETATDADRGKALNAHLNAARAAFHGIADKPDSFMILHNGDPTKIVPRDIRVGPTTRAKPKAPKNEEEKPK